MSETKLLDTINSPADVKALTGRRNPSVDY